MDGIDSPLCERELLLLVNERVITLDKKFDEFKEDNLAKYNDLRNELRCFKEQYQLESDVVNRKINMVEGIITFISLIGAVSGFIVVFIK